jgi:hypothetical protein
VSVLFAALVLLHCDEECQAFVPIARMAFYESSLHAFLGRAFVDQVQVYDNVFDTDVCWDLHDLAVEHTVRAAACDGSSVFYRDGSHMLTPLEQALDSCLTAMGDTDKDTVVEYWSRQDYINIDVHADIAEVDLIESQRIRCPDLGHVLYLVVNESNPNCPTVVFDQPNGWLTPSSDFLTVPAVVGRVLRFPGSAMHAVPQPADRWLLPDVDEKALRDQERDDVSLRRFSNDDIDDDSCDEDDNDEQVERSVILFNSWSRRGPEGVDQDPVGGNLPEGIEVEGEDLQDYIDSQRKNRFQDWGEGYGNVEDTDGDMFSFSELHCHPRSEWKEQIVAYSSEVTRDSSSPSTSVRLSLMGQKARRLHDKKNVRFEVQGDVKTALEQLVQPTLLEAGNRNDV